MSDLLSILSSLESSGSGTGISYYSTRCPVQAKLDKEFPRMSSFKAAAGTVFHKLMELYYQGLLKDVVLPIDDSPSPEDAVQEALRVFAVYQQYFAADEWTLIGVEKLLPENEAQAAIIQQAFGVSLTGRLDMIVSIDETQAIRLAKTRKIDVLPGVYIVDHKTHDKKDSGAGLKYSMSPQFMAYPHIWDLLNPDQPVSGVIVNDVTRHKKLEDGSFRSFVVPPPSEVQLAGLKKWLQWKAAFLASDIHDWGACFDWSGCSHYSNGNCQRV